MVTSRMRLSKFCALGVVFGLLLMLCAAAMAAAATNVETTTVQVTKQWILG